MCVIACCLLLCLSCMVCCQVLPMLWLCFVLPLFVSIFPFVVVSVCHCVLSGVVCCGYARCCNCTSMFVGRERESCRTQCSRWRLTRFKALIGTYIAVFLGGTSYAIAAIAAVGVLHVELLYPQFPCLCHWSWKDAWWASTISSCGCRQISATVRASQFRLCCLTCEVPPV